MSFDGRGVGLANATNTDTDTSARVHTTCRVCLAIYHSLVDPNIVQNHKAEFRAIKGEIALGIGRPFHEKGINYGMQRGLPMVFTNVAIFNTGRSDDLLKWYTRFYDCRSIEERVIRCGTSCHVKGQAYFPPELYFAGFVISDAEADPVHGDTALTLFIGGKRTVQNGRYPIHAGDEIMWYLNGEDELGVWDDEGKRIPRRPSAVAAVLHLSNPLPKLQQKVRDFAYAERAAMKQPALVKPCIRGIDGLGGTRADLSRIIGIAVSNAGAFERVDVKVGRQSL
jgi:hypothetical protein